MSHIYLNVFHFRMLKDIIDAWIACEDKTNLLLEQEEVAW